MALTKVEYIDNKTPIMAANLNAIQDAIIALENGEGTTSDEIAELQAQLDAIQEQIDNLFVIE